MNAKTNKFAIIGGGIVGMTAAYYLSRAGLPVTVFDYGKGQATRAAAGIICPWFSKRRNKAWYYLASHGAEFYHQLIEDLQDDGYSSRDIYEQVGCLLLRKTQKALDWDQSQAKEKVKSSPSMGQVIPYYPQEVKEAFPLLQSKQPASLVTGAGRVDGNALINLLKKLVIDNNGKIIKGLASIQVAQSGYEIHCGNYQQNFEQILLSPGPGLNDLLKPLQLHSDIQAQKGQLFKIYHPQWQNKAWPLVMATGGIDILPFPNGEIVIGSSHEDKAGEDLKIQPAILRQLKDKVAPFLSQVDQYPLHQVKVGTRAFTPDKGVLVGPLPHHEAIWAISGLGSSGLTSGPYLAYQWFLNATTNEHYLPENILSSSHYIKTRNI